uniref:Uncharacterized protein n=1 Tax=Rhizophora mucronata TaxID=61149 RepID=A0A2P2PUR6_RHIMU
MLSGSLYFGNHFSDCQQPRSLIVVVFGCM